MYADELRCALEAARLAGDYLRDAYASFQQIADAPADITTVADSESQEIVLKHLVAAFPNDSFSAEERTATLSGKPATGDRLWIVDPIDGTRGFARKNGEFSVMIGFVHDGEIALGIVHQPARDRLTYATSGGGCWRVDGGSSQPCRVTSTGTMDGATLTTSHSKPGKPSRAKLALRPGSVVESYSAGIKLALVARGEADVYVNSYEKFHDWDICAGHILVTEAGGRVSGLAGETLVYGTPGAWQTKGLIATNGPLHEEAIKRWRESPPEA